MPGTDRVEIRTLKEGRFCVVDDEAYKILSISKSKPGKQGSAKARLELVSLFTDKKISHVGTVTDSINVPMIEKGTASDYFRRSVWLYGALLADMEAALAEREWLAGAAYSLADVGLTPYVNRMAELELHGFWEGRFPRVTNWFARVRARPNFAAVSADYPYDDHAALMAERGRAHWPEVSAYLDG